MDPDDVDDPDARELRLGRRYLTLLVASLSLIALVCVTLLFPVPFVVISPGPAYNALGSFEGRPMITFGKTVKTYPAKGALDFTTVAVSRPDAHVSLAEAIAGYYSGTDEVVRRSSIYPDGESASDSEKLSHLLFESAQDSARVAALRAAGYKVPERALVASVDKHFPAYRHLRAGDIIVSVDGRRTPRADDVVKAIRARKPGASVTVGFERRDKVKSVTLRTVADPKSRSRPRVGISTVPIADPQLKIDFHLGNRIGGSSAGTMFALGIYDRLTPGSLTGGLHVAGTGTMKTDGAVGPIGGVRQKMIGAARNGAEVFLVPDANCKDAVLDADATGRYAHGMRLVRIKRLKDAIAGVRALARDSKASVPGCASPH